MSENEELRSGTLRVQTIVNEKKKKTKKTLFLGNMSPAEAELAPTLRALRGSNIDALDGKQVQFISRNGQPAQIRPSGEAWDAPPVTVQRAQTEQAAAGAANTPGDFYNPYNFIPTPARNMSHSELGDHSPVSHDRLHDDHWTGTISVTLTTKTPLLLPDPATMTTDPQNGHKTFSTCCGLDGRPRITPTEIRGALRSAYEAVTNSRMGIFRKHEDRLAYRMSVTDALELIPARIENGQIKLMWGTSPNLPTWGGSFWQVPGKLMYAAWLPHYNYGTALYPDKTKPQHGDHVWAVLQKCNKGRFFYWKVEIVYPYGSPPPTTPIPTATTQYVEGYAVVTYCNAENKHDERIFFNQYAPLKPPAITVTISLALRAKWKELITNYQEEHKDEISVGPSTSRNIFWSRHIRRARTTIPPLEDRELSDGTLCYARARQTGAGIEVTDLFPVMIARKLYETAPDTLLDGSLKPASTLNSLSPAERVFGWVNAERGKKRGGDAAYKGNLRIGQVQCQTPDALDSFGDAGLPLAILGQPKPAQGRFYAAQNTNGTPLNNGVEKAKGYQPGRGLRGRKVFPHQRLPERYWDNPTTDRTQTLNEGRYQEYRRPRTLNGVEQRDSQNRSMRDWVRAGAEFTFDLHVTNLSSAELGALLWLLTLPTEHYHKLGGGKPLGFGSVRLDIAAAALWTGAQWRDSYYHALDSDGPERQAAAVCPAVKECKKAFEDALTAAYSNPADTFLKAFLAAAKGVGDKPTHYPRLTANPDPKGESFKWSGKNEMGSCRALPALTDADPSLPYLP